MATERLFVSNTKVHGNNQWGKSLIEDISSAFDKVSNKIESVNNLIISGNNDITEIIRTVKEQILNTIGTIEKTADDAKRQSEQNAKDLFELKKTIAKLERNCYTLAEENKSLKDHTVKHELYSRKDNLIVNGILDNRNERAE